MKNKFIAGNWKMNKTVAETRQFIRELIPLVAGVKNRVALCVPYTDLAAAVEETKGTNIAVGAQNVHWAESGAFTGEISVAMLKEIGVEYGSISAKPTKRCSNARLPRSAAGLNQSFAWAKRLPNAKAAKRAMCSRGRFPRGLKTFPPLTSEASSSLTNPGGR